MINELGNLSEEWNDLCGRNLWWMKYYTRLNILNYKVMKWMNGGVIG